MNAVYLRVGDGAGSSSSRRSGRTRRSGASSPSAGPGMHHVAFEVDDVDGAVGELARRGATVIEAGPRPGLDGKRVAFVHPDSLHGVLAEVVGG